MNTDSLFNIGKFFFAAAIIAIGVTHLVTGNFPIGLEPLALAFTAKTLLANTTGIALITGGVLVFLRRYSYNGAILLTIIWLILFLLVHLPKLIHDVHDAGEWTAAFEVIELISGAMILTGNLSIGDNYTKGKSSIGKRLIITGRIIFSIGLIVFGILHFLYAEYIATLITGWIPLHLFWSYFVMVAFFAAALSFLINWQVKLASGSLSLMFFLWVIILHGPRAFAAFNNESEWTSLCIALAMSGIALLIGNGLVAASRNVKA